MKKISAIFVFMLILLIEKTNAQAFQYPSNPSPSWFVMDSGIAKAAAFTDTLLKGSHSLYLFQSMDSLGKGAPAFTYRYTDGNGTQLTFIYDYKKQNGSKIINFIEVDGRKEDVMDIFNHYFHTAHDWDREKETGNVREFVFDQKKYFLRMAENKKPDGDADGTVRSAMMNFQ